MDPFLDFLSHPATTHVGAFASGGALAFYGRSALMFFNRLLRLLERIDERLALLEQIGERQARIERLLEERKDS